MKRFVSLVTSFTLMSEVLTALPCDSHLRKTRPDLFKHCGNACQYGQWGSWSIISKFRADQCNSSKAYNQTRARHSFIKTCPSKSENKMICKCLYMYVFMYNRYNMIHYVLLSISSCNWLGMQMSVYCFCFEMKKFCGFCRLLCHCKKFFVNISNQ